MFRRRMQAVLEFWHLVATAKKKLSGDASALSWRSRPRWWPARSLSPRPYSTRWRSGATGLGWVIWSSSSPPIGDLSGGSAPSFYFRLLFEARVINLFLSMINGTKLLLIFTHRIRTFPEHPLWLPIVFQKKHSAALSMERHLVATLPLSALSEARTPPGGQKKRFEPLLNTIQVFLATRMNLWLVLGHQKALKKSLIWPCSF